MIQETYIKCPLCPEDITYHKSGIQTHFKYKHKQCWLQYKQEHILTKCCELCGKKLLRYNQSFCSSTCAGKYGAKKKILLGIKNKSSFEKRFSEISNETKAKIIDSYVNKRIPVQQLINIFKINRRYINEILICNKIEKINFHKKNLTKNEFLEQIIKDKLTNPKNIILKNFVLANKDKKFILSMTKRFKNFLENTDINILKKEYEDGTSSQVLEAKYSISFRIYIKHILDFYLIKVRKIGESRRISRKNFNVEKYISENNEIIATIKQLYFDELKSLKEVSKLINLSKRKTMTILKALGYLRSSSQTYFLRLEKGLIKQNTSFCYLYEYKMQTTSSF
jgi:hypothetical protein